MIHIPFTKFWVDWKLVALAVVFMAISSSWWRGLLAVAAILIARILLDMILMGVIVVLFKGKKRPRGMTWRAYSKIVQQDLQQYAGRRNPDNWIERMDEEWYVSLDCGHLVQDHFPDGRPEEGDKFWCWGHRKFGPAQEQTILSASSFRPPGEKRKVLS